MRELPAELAAHLAGETTTLCHCWRATRHDGAVLGFTDHDEDLSFDGTLFRASTGLEAAEASASFGFATGGGEVAGALGSDSLTETELAAGSWDSAKVETFLVNWREPSQRLRLRIGEIGEVRREGAAFTAELRSMAHRLEAKRGRLYTALCDANLGDARCKVKSIRCCFAAKARSPLRQAASNSRRVGSSALRTAGSPAAWSPGPAAPIPAFSPKCASIAPTGPPRVWDYGKRCRIRSRPAMRSP